MISNAELIRTPVMKDVEVVSLLVAVSDKEHIEKVEQGMNALLKLFIHELGEVSTVKDAKQGEKK